MSLNSTPTAERIHIGIFGKRNVGKSSLINAITGQSLSIVSETAGTTTDPVSKAMELLPLGAVLLTDTAGIDDSGALGEMRVKKTMKALDKTDIAVFVTDASYGFSREEEAFLKETEKRKIPYVIAYNKCDKSNAPRQKDGVYVSAKTGENIELLKEKIIAAAGKEEEPPIVSDIVNPGSTVILVTPIDSSAPKGRLILPQQMTIRELLDNGCIAVVCKDAELKSALKRVGSPDLVITDSQAFSKVASEIGENVPLTSFSILMARRKGGFDNLLKGTEAMKSISDGDTILISEGCTHHRQCRDIGSVKLPACIRKYTGKNPRFEFTSGGEFPEDLTKYKLIIHCGACMLNRREVQSRINRAIRAEVPITNYGLCLAECEGILSRCVKPIKA